ncbi:hypothetical protein [Nocardia sp. NPDC049149]|uniref:hypothetical protein n=1 Tax=Nocardia sp. NPDC049149 TaxID=3364315 RepID=UPI00370FB0A0
MTDDEFREALERAAEALNVLVAELHNERISSRELFTRVEAAENALDDAQRGWRGRVSDWWQERRGGGI